MSFTLGFVAGLSWIVPFVLGLFLKSRLEDAGYTARAFVPTKVRKPIVRTDAEEAELEEMLDAQRGR